MANFFFIDTNLIIGYCNHLDRLHQVSKDYLDLLNENWSKNIILLYSIEHEFNRKIQDVISLFLLKIGDLIKSGIIKIDEIKKNWGILSNFEKYIFNLFEQEGKIEVDLSDFIKISLKYNQNIRETFDSLVRDWIKRPKARDYLIIKNTRLYKRTFRKVKRLTHKSDREHITLAILEVYDRLEYHEFIFYTGDNYWVGVDTALAIPNFKIKIPLIERIYIGFKPVSNYILKVNALLKLGFSCLILARGFFINKAADTCLKLRENLCPGLKIDKILIDSERRGGRRLSIIKIYISN